MLKLRRREFIGSAALTTSIIAGCMDDDTSTENKGTDEVQENGSDTEEYSLPEGVSEEGIESIEDITEQTLESMVSEGHRSSYIFNLKNDDRSENNLERQLSYNSDEGLEEQRFVIEEDSEVINKSDLFISWSGEEAYQRIKDIEGTFHEEITDDLMAEGPYGTSEIFFNETIIDNPQNDLARLDRFTYSFNQNNSSENRLMFDITGFNEDSWRDSYEDAERVLNSGEMVLDSEGVLVSHEANYSMEADREDLEVEQYFEVELGSPDIQRPDWIQEV